MNTRRAGSGRQRPSLRSAASSSSNRLTPYRSTSAMVCRSMPAAPRLARTSSHARSSAPAPEHEIVAADVVGIAGTVRQFDDPPDRVHDAGDAEHGGDDGAGAR